MRVSLGGSLACSTKWAQSVDVSSAAAAGDSRCDAIVAAARTIFLHYGFRRASLDLIAGEAGISRTGLYHHFANKEDVFRAMVDALYAVSLAGAAEAAAGEGTVEDKLVGVLRAKPGFFHEVLAGARHGAEILDESNRLCGERIAEGRREFHRILAGVLRDNVRSGAVDLARPGLSVDAAATLLELSAYGVKGSDGAEPVSPAQYTKRLQQLVRVFLVGLAGDAA
jgi:TetR/AcrR family transcriptional repressor of mexJK operon